MSPRFFLLLFAGCVGNATFAQDHEWIAPEGKIINDRTLTWADFLGKPTKQEKEIYGAATQPAIYFIADHSEEHPNERVTFSFKVKCAFQSASWVSETTEQEKGFSEYALNHEQEHYDIALTCAYKLQAELSGRDYSLKDYQREIDSIYYPLYRKFLKSEDDYDEESKHGIIKENQELWDMRIKKCLENYSTEYYTSPLSVVQTVKYMIQYMKRIPNEPAKQFAVRARPMYSEFNEEMGAKLVETNEWTAENKMVIACYYQKYKATGPDGAEKDGKRILAYALMPQLNNNYKRVLLDTFAFDDKPPKITGIFFANADSDQAKELVITTSMPVKDGPRSGIQFTTTIYDNTTTQRYPARLTKLSVSGIDANEVEGTVNGKPTHARLKSEKDIRDQFKKLGYAN